MYAFTPSTFLIALCGPYRQALVLPQHQWLTAELQQIKG
jgi:hypothetical protein